MAIRALPGLAMPNPYAPGQPGAIAVRNDAQVAVGALTYGQLWRQPRNNPLTDTPNVRLDLQGYTGDGEMNLQLQVNVRNVHSTTVATVLVARTVQAIPPPSERSVPQQADIVRVIKSALFSSLADYNNNNPRIWTVTGTPSS